MERVLEKVAELYEVAEETSKDPSITISEQRKCVALLEVLNGLFGLGEAEEFEDEESRAKAADTTEIKFESDDTESAEDKPEEKTVDTAVGEAFKPAEKPATEAEPKDEPEAEPEDKSEAEKPAEEAEPEVKPASSGC